MNKMDRQRIIGCVRSIIYLRSALHEKSGEDQWNNLEGKQAYYDVLNALRHHGLILNFAIDWVTFPDGTRHSLENGKWTVDYGNKSS